MLKLYSTSGRLRKSAVACLAADVHDADGDLTLEQLAKVFRVSAGYLSVACRLSPTERDLVCEGLRPLFPPKISASIAA